MSYISQIKPLALTIACDRKHSSVTIYQHIQLQNRALLQNVVGRPRHWLAERCNAEPKLKTRSWILSTTIETAVEFAVCWRLNRQCVIESAICRRSNTVHAIVGRTVRSPTASRNNSSDLHLRGEQRQTTRWLNDSHSRISFNKLTVFLQKCHSN